MRMRVACFSLGKPLKYPKPAWSRLNPINARFECKPERKKAKWSFDESKWVLSRHTVSSCNPVLDVAQISPSYRHYLGSRHWASSGWWAMMSCPDVWWTSPSLAQSGTLVWSASTLSMWAECNKDVIDLIYCSSFQIQPSQSRKLLPTAMVLHPWGWRFQRQSCVWRADYLQSAKRGYNGRTMRKCGFDVLDARPLHIRSSCRRLCWTVWKKGRFVRTTLVKWMQNVEDWVEMKT